MRYITRQAIKSLEYFHPKADEGVYLPRNGLAEQQKLDRPDELKDGQLVYLMEMRCTEENVDMRIDEYALTEFIVNGYSESQNKQRGVLMKESQK